MKNTENLPDSISLTRLDNGLRVITESMPGVRSVSVGCWFRTGSRDETNTEAGVSHFLEHLLFKETENRTSRQIADAFDVMGAESNAFTSKDHTCFFARTLDDDLESGLDILADMLQHPAFLPNEIETEKQVVIEEINRSEDNPDEVAMEKFSKQVFAGHPLADPIYGSRESIITMTRETIDKYWANHYGPETMVLSVAGSCQHEAVVELASSLFGGWDSSAADQDNTVSFTPTSGIGTEKRKTKQAHLFMGGVGLDYTDERRWAFGILSLILGGGMSSRLFQKIREERGLAYAVGSFTDSFADTGLWGVYAGTTTSHTRQVLDLVRSELSEVMKNGITGEELARAQSHLRGSLALSLEDPNSRMVRNGRAESLGIPHLSMDERIQKIESTTLEQVQSSASEIFSSPKVIGAVGRFKPAELSEFVQW